MAELWTLRFSMDVTRMDKIKNEYIRNSAHVRQFGDKKQHCDSLIISETETVW